MKALFNYIASIALAFAVASLSTTPTVFAAGETGSAAMAAQSGRALTTDELYSVYRNRSWIWDDGAGHFRVSRREFTAWTKSSAEGSYADGTWFLPREGRLCFQAQWNAVEGSSGALTCFDHRTANGEIYQRRLPDGEWYVFRHQPQRPSDEISKLRRGDHVRQNYERNKRYIDARTPRKECSTLLCALFGR